MSVFALPRTPQGTWARIWHFVVTVPWIGLGLYFPNGLLALPAAYASSQFAAHGGVFPAPFNIMIGVAFEWVYLGSLAVAASQKVDVDSKARWWKRVNWWWVIVNTLGVAASITYVTLHAATNPAYNLINFDTAGTTTKWAFAIIHGAPLALLNFCYSMLIHGHLRSQAEQEALTKYVCAECGVGFKSPAALNGHRKGCKPASV